MTAGSNRPYIPAIDQLRGFAALLVLLYHGFHVFGAQFAYGVAFTPEDRWPRASNPIIAVIVEGHTGVGLFIVLSGFVLSLGAIGRRIEYRRFVLARVLRIYPVLLVMLTIGYVIHPVSLVGLLGSLPPLNTAGSVPGSSTAMFWAVAVEFQCYLIFPLLLYFSDRIGTGFLFQVIVISISLRALLVFADVTNARDISYWTVLGRVDQFCIGMIAARMNLRGNWNEKPGLLPITAAAAVAMTILWGFNRVGGWPAMSAWKLLWPTIEGAQWAAFILAYLGAASALPASLAAATARLGEVSYSGYMVHFAVVQLVVRQRWFVRATGDNDYDAILTTMLVAFPIVVCLATLLFATIEKPFLRLRPRYILPLPDILPLPAHDEPDGGCDRRG
jgi:peptidoglycan/LPS O-acetylase OafA/YrhL